MRIFKTLILLSVLIISDLSYGVVNFTETFDGPQIDFSIDKGIPLFNQPPGKLTFVYEAQISRQIGLGSFIMHLNFSSITFQLGTSNSIFYRIYDGSDDLLMFQVKKVTSGVQLLYQKKVGGDATVTVLNETIALLNSLELQVVWDEAVKTYKISAAYNGGAMQEKAILVMGDVSPNVNRYEKLYTGGLNSSYPAQPTITLDYYEMLPMQASNPSPFNGEENVNCNAKLTWQPGSLAQAHNIFFGTDTALVENAEPLYGDINSDGTVSLHDFSLLATNWKDTILIDPKMDQNYDGLIDILDIRLLASNWLASGDGIFKGCYSLGFETYEPGILNPMTTYYWRIDDVQDDGIKKGIVWSFKTGSPMSNCDPDHIVLNWSAAEFEESYKVYVGIASSYSQVAYISGTSTTVSDLKPNTTYNWYYRSYDINGDFVKQSSKFYFTTGDIDPRKPVMPIPADGSVISKELPNILNWTPGSAGISYNIYFGKDSKPDETEFRGNLTGDSNGHSYMTGLLEPNTQYYWRIDTILDVNGTILTGRTWTFNTDGEPNKSVNIDSILYADDFENGDINQTPVGWICNADGNSMLNTVAGRTGKSLKISQSAWIKKRISTENMKNIKISYKRSLSGYASSESLKCQWSPDGNTWNQLISEQTGSFNDPPVIVSCDANANNCLDFWIRFIADSTNASSYAYLDNIRVMGVYSPTVPKRDANHYIVGANVMFLGDSLTATGSDLWCVAVAARLNLNVLTAHAYDPNDHSDANRLPNHGKGGSCAYQGPDRVLPDYTGRPDPDPKFGGYQRLRYALEVDLHLPAQPDFVIINFGMNDHKRVWREGISSPQYYPDDYALHLKMIVDYVRAHGAVPVLVTPHDFFQGTPDNLESYYSAYSPELFNNAEDNYSALGRYHIFIDKIREVAKGNPDEGRAPVDLIELNLAANRYDTDEFTTSTGVHCTSFGHSIYAKIIGDYLSARFGDGR